MSDPFAKAVSDLFSETAKLFVGGLDEATARVAVLESAIRKHRDQRGDDRCWMDDEELYRVLPEGYVVPVRDTAVELSNCERFIRCRHNPGTVYVSPEREIEELRAEVGRLKIAGRIAMLGLTGIVKDDALKCHCGEDPYTDGIPCPKCFAAEAQGALRIQLGDVQPEMMEMVQVLLGSVPQRSSGESKQ